MSSEKSARAEWMHMYSQSYKRYVTLLLLVVYIFNQLDRAIFGILMEPIKHEMLLSDTQLGLLAGPALATFYALLGIPIARLGDRSYRINIMSVAVMLWSGVVALTAAVQGFWQFALVRVGVGIGEAGFSSIAQSVIGDYHSPRERTRALSVFMLGLPIGQAASYLLGGVLNEAWGWRAAFIAAGAPGLLLAVLMKWTVQEPPRATQSATTQVSHPSLSTVFATMWQCPSLRHLSVAMMLSAMLLGVLGWKATFYIRIHGVSTGVLGAWLAFVMGVGGALGIWLSGDLMQRLKIHDEKLQTRVIAVSAILTSVFVIIALLWPSTTGSFMWLLAGLGALNFFFAPSFSLVHALTPTSMRATVVSVIILLQLLCSGVVGWLATGMLSDAFSSSLGAEGLRWAMIALAPVSAWAAVHFLRAGSSIREDLRAVSTRQGEMPQEGVKC